MSIREGRNGGVLKVIEPGGQGNPGAGRPKGSPNVKTTIRKWFSIEQEVTNPYTGNMESMTPLDMIVVTLIANACRGDVAASKELMDRYEGKAVQSVEITPKPIPADPSEDDLLDISTEDLIKGLDGES